ncbi:MAG TPA: dihydropteroate synthase [Acetobacteraceae bacterium]|jgi:dihydropteroate synthase
MAEPASHPHAGTVASWAGLSLDQPRIMGVLNVTPDSFSDGGAYADTDAAIAAGLAMVAAGADIVDVGGESTRPGSPPTAPEEECRRVVPVVRALAAAGVRVSIDTRNGATMQAALDAGAAIVNDVSALTHDPRAAAVVAAARCPVVLMHMRGTPDTMNARAVYADLAGEVAAELRARIDAAEVAGVAREAIAIDPGIGFAKLAPQSVELLRRLPELAVLGRPILVGVSRKSFIGRITGEADPRRRLPASLAAALFALSRGARILRVHDVAETVQALRMWQALTGGA